MGYDTINTLRRYYKQCLRYDDVEAYQTSLAHIASSALADSDYTSHLLGNTPMALYGRYEMREGAANCIETMFGLDMSMARQVMQTRDAWLDCWIATIEEEIMNNKQVLVKLNEPYAATKGRRTKKFDYALISFVNPKPPVLRSHETMAFACDEQGNVFYYGDVMREWYDKEPEFERYASELGGEIVRTIWEEEQ